LALGWAARQAFNEHNPAEVDRLVSELIELFTRHNFVAGCSWEEAKARILGGLHGK
jgi:hypothetical protein